MFTVCYLPFYFELNCTLPVMCFNLSLWPYTLDTLRKDLINGSIAVIYNALILEGVYKKVVKTQIKKVNE